MWKHFTCQTCQKTPTAAANNARLDKLEELLKDTKNHETEAVGEIDCAPKFRGLRTMWTGPEFPHVKKYTSILIGEPMSAHTELPRTKEGKKPLEEVPSIALRDQERHHIRR